MTCVHLCLDLSVIGLPPPASGVLVAFILNIVAALSWSSNSQIKYQDSMMYHQMLEVGDFSHIINFCIL